MTYWRVTYDLLDRANIDRALLYATNIHPAYHRTTRGAVPLRPNPNWYQAAVRLLCEQITVMRPRLIVVFGDAATATLRRRGELGLGMSGLRRNTPIRTVLGGIETVAVSCYHPSAWTTTQQNAQRLAAVRTAWKMSEAGSRIQ